jgi:hypothetical protein
LSRWRQEAKRKKDRDRKRKEGFVYLSLVMDMFAKDIVGWAMSDTLETESGPLLTGT